MDLGLCRAAATHPNPSVQAPPLRIQIKSICITTAACSTPPPPARTRWTTRSFSTWADGQVVQVGARAPPLAAGRRCWEDDDDEVPLAHRDRASWRPWVHEASSAREPVSHSRHHDDDYARLGGRRRRHPPRRRDERDHDWAMMDRLVASHLNGHAAGRGSTTENQLCFDGGGATDADGLAFYRPQRCRPVELHAVGACCSVADA